MKIKDYIQFAINNGYSDLILRTKYSRVGYNSKGNWYYSEINEEMVYLPIITSKPFIESIARGLRKQGGYEEVMGDWDFSLNDAYIDFINELIKKQAIAIGDNKLPEFIINLLG